VYSSKVPRKPRLTRIEEKDNTTKGENKKRFSRSYSLTSISSDYAPRAPLSFSNNSSTGKCQTLSNINLKFSVVERKPIEIVEFLGEKENIGKVPSLSADTNDNAEMRDKEKAKFVKEKCFGK